MNLVAKLSMEHNGKVYSWLSVVVILDPNDWRHLILDVPYTLNDLIHDGITVVNYFPAHMFNVPDFFYPPPELADVL